MAAFTPKFVHLQQQINMLTGIRTASKNITFYNLCNRRNIHSACRSHFSKLHNIKTNNLYPNEKSQWYRLTSVRHKSTETVAASLPNESAIPWIPEPPPIPVNDSGISEIIETIGEPTLVSLGLGGWSPVGMLQTCLEHLHVGLDLPWFAAIAVGTCIVRMCMFPLIIYAQRNAAKTNNNMPQMQAIQLKMTEARKNGDALEASKYGYELMVFMKEKGITPFKNFLVPLCQMPVFVSFFFALKGLANLPVEALKTGGLYWFSNLTIADPFYILPVITSATMLLTIELGIESGMRADNLQIMRYVFRAIPILVFPFIMNFPAAVLCYWVTSNFISLIQAAILRVPPIREFFKIQPLIHHSPDMLPMKKKNMMATMKDTLDNARIAREIEGRGRVDEMRFRKAGMGPIQKTFSYDPSKQTETPGGGPAAVKAKSADGQ